MSAPEAALRTTWHRLAGPGHDVALERLLLRLADPRRRYHTATHVMWVLRHIDDIVAALEPAAVATLDLAAIRWAALYHDAVYEPDRDDNEALSAQLARTEAAAAGWSAERQAAVHRLVMATAAHRPAALDEAVLVDADLAVLGAPANDYTAYTLGVRAEYAHVDETAWRAGRAVVLQHLLGTEPLFHTAAMRADREARARANLTAELAALRG